MDNKFKIINYLGKNIEEKFTMHELSNKLEIPYATFYRVIKDLHLIQKEKKGSSNLIQLKKEQIIASYLAVSSEEEKTEYLEKKPIIRKIQREIRTKEIVLLFGSYAKKKEEKNSDIDLLIVNDKGERTISFSKYETLFKKKINPIFISKEELKKMLKEKEENVGKQALKNHVILNNAQEFWEIVNDLR